MTCHLCSEPLTPPRVLREDGRVVHLACQQREDEEAGLRSEAEGAEREAIRAERVEHERRLLERREALAGASARITEIMRMRYDEGLTYRAIGDAFNITKSRVMQLIREHEQRLRECPPWHAEQVGVGVQRCPERTASDDPQSLVYRRYLGPPQGVY